MSRKASHDSRWSQTTASTFQAGWEVSRLGDICEFSRASVDPGAFPDELFEYYSIPAFQQRAEPGVTPGRDILSRKLLVDPGTVLFGKLNPRVPKVWRVQVRTRYRKLASTEFLALYPGPRVDGDFMRFLCSSQHVMGIAEGLVTGSTPSRQRVDPSAFSDIHVPVPPLTEQHTIAALLSRLQDAMKAQDRLSATLKNLKAATMAKFFREGVRRELLKQTEIGRIPRGWEVRPLKSALREPLRNGHSAVESTDGTGVRTLTLTAVTKRSFSEANTKITRADPRRVHDLWLTDGDIFVERANTAEMVGLAALYNGPDNFAIFPDLLIRVRVRPELLFPDVLEHWFLSPWCRAYFQRHCRGAATSMPKIDHQTLEELPIPIPPPREQREMGSTFNSLDERLTSASHRVTALQHLFSSSLKLLMTGQVRVPRDLIGRLAALRPEGPGTYAHYGQPGAASSQGKPDEAVLQAIVRRIVEAVAPERIILFGSAARGEMGPDSDLDLLVVKACERPRDLARQIRRQLRDVAPGLPKEIVVVTPEHLERHRDTIGYIFRPALREGRVLYAA